MIKLIALNLALVNPVMPDTNDVYLLIQTEASCSITKADKQANLKETTRINFVTCEELIRKALEAHKKALTGED